MKKLIIAEKPSLGRTIAAAFLNMEKANGYLENKDEIIVTWAFGHLFEAVCLEEYREDYDSNIKYRFKDTGLPMLPEKLKYRVKDNCKEQFDVIKKLMNRDDIDEIISAGDADREGEVIIRLIIEKGLDKNKTITRLWLPDQTVETIQKAYNNRKNIKEYNNIYEEGIARSYMDWIWGINLSREVAIRGGMKCSVGRVITPIVLSIYNREKDILSFKKDYYYNIVSEIDIKGMKLKVSDKEKINKENENFAYEKAALFNNGILKVENVERKSEKKSAGKLFSLSKLQGVAGKIFKLSPANTLELVQVLYEKGLVTYPRTNTEYLSENEKSKINEIIALFKERGKDVTFKDNKTIFDDSKIESHSAITPTGKEPIDLNENEQSVYSLILNRFLAVFCSKDCLLDVVNITLQLQHNKGKEEFLLKGKTLKEKGWMEIEKVNMNDTFLPDLMPGEILKKDFQPILKETQPPKYFTVETLNEYLKNPFKKDIKEAEDEEYKSILDGAEIGTEATRAGLIDKAISLNYISLKNNLYNLLPDGKRIIDVLYELNMIIDVQNTVLMATKLKSIYKGDINKETALQWSRELLSGFFENAKGITIEKDINKENIVGKCPLCKANVLKIQGQYGNFYSCSDYKNGCKLKISGNIAGKKLTEDHVKILLKGRPTNKISGFKSKKGTTFSSKLKLTRTGEIEFIF